MSTRCFTITVPVFSKEKTSRIEKKFSVSSERKKRKGRRKNKRSSPLGFYERNILTQVGSNAFFCALNSSSVIRAERATSHKYQTISAWKLLVAFCRISLLTLNLSRGKESLRSGKHSKKQSRIKRQEEHK